MRSSVIDLVFLKFQKLRFENQIYNNFFADKDFFPGKLFTPGLLNPIFSGLLRDDLKMNDFS